MVAERLLIISALMFTTILFALAPAIPEAAPAPAPPLALDPSVLALTQDEGADEMVEPEWTGSVALGATFTSGNTETQNYSADANAELRQEDDRWTWKAFWNYATDRATGTEVVTARKAGTSLQYDRFLNEEETTYLYGLGSAEHDSLAELDMRSIIGAGAGYQFYDEPDFEVQGEFGLNYIVEDFSTATKDDYIAARLAAKLRKEISESTTFSSSAEVYPSLEEADDVNGKWDSKLQSSLTASMFTSLQYVLDFDNTPSGGAERVDQRIVFALGWSF